MIDSAISAVDVASENAQMSRNQVLSQARAWPCCRKANQLPQQALRLLQG
jgi:flagellin-like hook-associated protein FlgL